MHKTYPLLSITLFFLFCLFTAVPISANSHNIIWHSMNSGINDTDLQLVAVSPANPDKVFASSSNAVYKTTNGGNEWNEVFSLRGTGKGINHIATSPSNPDTIYAGTDEGLFASYNEGAEWQRVYSGINALENSVLAIAVNPIDPDVLHIGTLNGILTTTNKGREWAKSRNLPSNTMVTALAIDPADQHRVYAATDSGIYQSKNNAESWERTYSASFHEKEAYLSALRASLESNENDFRETKRIIINSISVKDILPDYSVSRKVYAATSEGLYISSDQGSTWVKTSSLGLLSQDIRHIDLSGPGVIYASTGRGVFRYTEALDAWEELYKGLPTHDIRMISASATNSSQEPVWAATKAGIFVSRSVASDETLDRQDARNLLSMFSHEPTIGQIRKAAIDYAEVSPEKIKSWRKAASRKAWLPDFRIDYDKGRDWQNSYSFYKVDGEYVKYDDVTSDRDEGWSISATWSLGDLIYTSDQTSIDSRSKLMVQLRDDILKEVTRLYFERRRLQIDMVTSPAEDSKTLVEKELRVHELTANIDALTGAYLTRKIAQQEVRAPGQQINYK